MNRDWDDETADDETQGLAALFMFLIGAPVIVLVLLIGGVTWWWLA
jgi:hypothetical protein